MGGARQGAHAHAPTLVLHGDDRAVLGAAAEVLDAGAHPDARERSRGTEHSTDGSQEIARKVTPSEGARRRGASVVRSGQSMALARAT